MFYLKVVQGFKKFQLLLSINYYAIISFLFRFIYLFYTYKIFMIIFLTNSWRNLESGSGVHGDRSSDLSLDFLSSVLKKENGKSNVIWSEVNKKKWMKKRDVRRQTKMIVKKKEKVKNVREENGRIQYRSAFLWCHYNLIKAINWVINTILHWHNLKMFFSRPCPRLPVLPFSRFSLVFCRLSVSHRVPTWLYQWRRHLILLYSRRRTAGPSSCRTW